MGAETKTDFWNVLNMHKQALVEEPHWVCDDLRQTVLNGG